MQNIIEQAQSIAYNLQGYKRAEKILQELSKAQDRPSLMFEMLEVSKEQIELAIDRALTDRDSYLKDIAKKLSC